MKKKTKLLLICIFIISVSIVIVFQRNTITTLQKNLNYTKNNEKALLYENSNIKSINRVLEFNIEQLNYYNDSLNIKLNDIRKELKIKNKDLKQMQYLLSEASKKDTLVFRDTLFKDSFVAIDTLLGDKWYNIKLSLKFPNTIITEPKFTSEKYVIMNYKRETIDPPKKFFIARWFQKKHKVVEVEVVEKNPYIENKQQRFIEIVK